MGGEERLDISAGADGPEGEQEPSGREGRREVEE